MTHEEIAEQVLATVPKGWEFVRYGKPRAGEMSVSGDRVFPAVGGFEDDYVIVKRKTRRVVMGGTWRSLGRVPLVDEWYYRPVNDSRNVREFYRRPAHSPDSFYADALALEMVDTYTDQPEPTE